MNTRLVELNKVHANKKNPRTISADKFKKLINSLLSLPKMLEIRPIAVDGKGVSLGGNMRLRALNEIAKMSADELSKRLDTVRDVKKKKAEERKALIDYWVKWLSKPVVTVVDVSTLTPAEQKEFIIKDNGDFGQWDYDALANEWNADDLNDWGVDVWQNKEVDDVFNAGSAPAPETPANGSALSPEATEILANEQDNDNPVDFSGNLPSELQGVDLNPENLPKIQGSDETPFERIIIVYPKERKGELLGMLGMADINKVVYHLDEILGENINSIDTDEE
jgi:hypothetical protein